MVAVAGRVEHPVRVLGRRHIARPPRRQTPRADVALAIRGLSVLGWLDVVASADLPVEETALIGV
jgi:hypothetical protein